MGVPEVVLDLRFARANNTARILVRNQAARMTAEGWARDSTAQLLTRNLRGPALPGFHCVGRNRFEGFRAEGEGSLSLDERRIKKEFRALTPMIFLVHSGRQMKVPSSTWFVPPWQKVV
jgi:hypothetical protein